MHITPSTRKLLNAVDNTPRTALEICERLGLEKTIDNAFALGKRLYPLARKHIGIDYNLEQHNGRYKKFYFKIR